MGTAWLYAGYPGLVNNGYGERFEELTREFPPESSDVSKASSYAETLKHVVYVRPAFRHR